MGRFKDIKGQVFSYWTVLEFSHVHTSPNGTRQAYWKCQCKCGILKSVCGSDLRNRASKSCGCLQKNRRRSDIYNWTGYEEITGTLWTSYKKGAAKRKLIFEISQEYAWSKFINQNRKCALSGVPIHFSDHYSEKSTASLDRIDNSKGYIEGNVQWVHKDVNFMKGTLSQDYFLELCQSISSTLDTKAS